MFGELRPVDGGMPILLAKPSIMVGQDQTCDVVIEHPSVSATHCHMEFRDGHWFIEDLGSRCGTLVNGEKIASAWVPAWSVICIGSVEFDLQSSSTHTQPSETNTVSEELLSKLDQALKSVPEHQARRIQVRADAPSPPDVPQTTLGWLKPSAGGQPIPLLYDELYVGRDPDRDVILPYLAVAKTHCVLRFQNGYWLVRDLNNNGIRIDGQTVPEGWLLPGAVLSVANHQFEVAYSTSASSPPPETVVPVNEFDVSNEDTWADSDDSFIVTDAEANNDNTSAIDLNTELDAYNAMLAEREAETSQVGPSEQAIHDEPLLAIDDTQLTFEGALPTLEAPSLPVEPPAKEPPLTSQKTPSKRKPRTSSRRKKAASTSADVPSEAAPQPAAVEEPRQLVVSLKHEQIRRLLKERELDGLLLTRPANLAWWTEGADVPHGLFGEPVAAMLVNHEGATVLARPADAELLRKQIIPGMNPSQRDCDWPAGSPDVLQDWGGEKNWACDQAFEQCADVSADVAALRLPLSESEVVTLRKLGIRVARALERAAREFRRGDTEAQIAGDIASRLVRHEVIPERIQVWGDGRAQNCPNWKFCREPVERCCTISVVGRRQGLHVAVSRTVSFGIPPKELRWTYTDMLMAHATAMLCSQSQADVAGVWSRVENACQKLGCADDWRVTTPGCVTGYELCEAPIVPQSPLRLRTGMPMIWQSSIGPARAVDTILVQDDTCKVLTQTGEWPQISLVIGQARIFGQTILQRAV